MYGVRYLGFQGIYSAVRCKIRVLDTLKFKVYTADELFLVEDVVVLDT